MNYPEAEPSSTCSEWIPGLPKGIGKYSRAAPYLQARLHAPG
jgi:hypothetical protein